MLFLFDVIVLLVADVSCVPEPVEIVCSDGRKAASRRDGCGPIQNAGSEVNLLFNVTINDISVIYVTAHRCAGGLKKKLDLRSDSHAIDIS